MAANDLTTLQAAKAWLSITGDGDDALLQNLIGQVSGFVLSFIQRPSIFKKQFLEQFSGSGGSVKMLRNYPVIAVSSVLAGQQSVPASGYWLDPDDGMPPGRLQAVNLVGYVFPRCLCKVTYDAGYFIAAEPQTAADSVFVEAPFGAWMVDGGVAYASGTAMVLVASGPIQGQYALGDRGEYVFADADAGAAVLISYSYVPAQLEQACLELVAERYAYRDRVGQSSVNTSGQIVAFSLKDMPDYVRTALQPFRRVVPV